MLTAPYTGRYDRQHQPPTANREPPPDDLTSAMASTNGPPPPPSSSSVVSPLFDDDDNDEMLDASRRFVSRTPTPVPTTPAAVPGSAAREVRTVEALRVKDEQLRILTEHNDTLMATLDSTDDALAAARAGQGESERARLQAEHAADALRQQVAALQREAAVAAVAADGLRHEVAELRRAKAAASFDGHDLLDLSAQECGDLVAGLGSGYASYRAMFEQDGIDGVFLDGLSEEEMGETLREIGVEKVLHIKNIFKHFQRLYTGTDDHSHVGDGCPPTRHGDHAEEHGGVGTDVDDDDDADVDDLSDVDEDGKEGMDGLSEMLDVARRSSRSSGSHHHQHHHHQHRQEPSPTGTVTSHSSFQAPLVVSGRSSSLGAVRIRCVFGPPGNTGNTPRLRLPRHTNPPTFSAPPVCDALYLEALQRVRNAIEQLDMPKRVSVSPRDLMAELLKIQGVALDPSEIDVAVQKICMIVGHSNGACDGVETHDVFINYRVAADADLAEMLYYALKSVGIHAFLDRKCLRDGEPWLDGFIKGLSSSRKIICLMSRAALARVKVGLSSPYLAPF